MATRFAIFSGERLSPADVAKYGNVKMAKIESSGGRYVASHCSALGPSDSNPFPTVVLTIVYEEGSQDKGATARSF